MASTPDSSEDHAVPEQLLQEFDRVAQLVGLDIAVKRARQLKKTPKGATLDPQKSRERLAVGLALEEGLSLGVAIRRATGVRVKADASRYAALYRAFTVGGAAPFWQAVARRHVEAAKEAAKIDELIRVGQVTLDWEEFTRRCEQYRARWLLELVAEQFTLDEIAAWLKQRSTADFN
jgi:hypothetical protein